MRPHPIVTCSKPLAANASAAPLDVVKMKSALCTLGHYDAPEWGLSQFPDVALFDAIKAFQKSQGLKADGAIKPDGETEAALSQAMTPRRATTALQATAQALQSMGRGGDELLAHITPEEAALLHTVTDGGSINPQTGLLEFRFDPSADHKANQSDSSSTDDSSDDGDSNDHGRQGSDGYGRGQGSDPDGDAKDNNEDGQNAQENESEGLMGAKQKEDKTKADADRRNRAAGQTVDDGGLLSTNAEDDEEDADDWNSSLLGEDDSAPQEAPATNPNTPKDDKPNPEPKSDNGGKLREAPSLLEGMAESLKAIFSGTYEGPHSPYDVEKAEYLKDKYGGKRADYLRGGDYGPGGGYYSPDGNYDAQLGNRADGSGLTTGKSVQNNPAFLTPDHPEYIATDALDAFEADAQKTQQENRQRMADIAKARQRTRLAAQKLAKNRAAQAAGAPKDVLGRGASTIGSLTPQDGPMGRTLDQKAADVGEQPIESQDGLLGRSPDQKAADVGEHPMADYDPSTAGTLVGGFRTSTSTARKNLVSQLAGMVMRNPKALKTLHPEIQSYYTAHQETLHNPYGYRPEPQPWEANYDAKMKTHKVWSIKRQQQADLAGLNAAYSQYSHKALASPFAELTKDFLIGADAVEGKPYNKFAVEKLSNWIENAIPTAYMDAPSYRRDLRVAEPLAWGLDELTPLGIFTSAGHTSEKLRTAGFSKRAQVTGTRIITTVRVFSAPLSLLGKKAAKTGLKALSHTIKQNYGRDLSYLSSKELDDLISALAEEGIEMTADGAVQGVIDVFDDSTVEPD